MSLYRNLTAKSQFVSLICVLIINKCISFPL
ncbi:protein of unknown function [Vibrio tapetis subsp. tapetis]|uniref:Uncharacterized protein n=1 Tax=Vibrio tapetis subsp. tapetis TaxID=1671868 RepID=A0A2N8Z7V5_9VIBR|nr:protein of unknown function [Vibrio tapetis subsp. tapetis]